MSEILEKQGYKYTEEFGYIPDDWEYKTFGDISTVNQGLQIAISNRYLSPAPNRYVYITIQYLNSLENPEYIENPQKSVICNKDDLLMTRTGNTGVLVTNVEGVFHNNFFKINYDRAILNKKFLTHYLSTNKLRSMILLKAGLTTIPDLSHGSFFSLPIIIPPLKEQEKIAEVLGDVDSLIDKTQQLINKKKDLKTATMQKLFTPKEDWKWISFDELGTCISTSNLSWNDVTEDGVTLCILYGELFTTYNEIAKNIVSKTNINTVVAQKNDILFPTSTTVDNISLIAPSCLMADNIGVGGDLFIFRPYHSNGIYLSYLINNYSEIKNKLANRAQGLTIIHLHYENIKDIKLPIPPMEEQDKIATILSDMDAEIEALEKELNKYKDLKTGMMQQLLTGKVRLI